MALSAGTRLGPYEILSPLGAGGMGQVYRARDPRMGREVAIKLSAERFSDRFEREVRAVAALNHTNICQVYDVGPNYLVMELIEGPTLSDRIKAGAIPLDDALAIARQIGDALDAAHEKGIIHRDLKPANVKIKPDGTVKVLDFGLAKVAQASACEDPEASPTLNGMVQDIEEFSAELQPVLLEGRPVTATALDRIRRRRASRRRGCGVGAMPSAGTVRRPKYPRSVPERGPRPTAARTRNTSRGVV
jgi:serine/threonine protein kinase